MALSPLSHNFLTKLQPLAVIQGARHGQFLLFKGEVTCSPNSRCKALLGSVSKVDLNLLYILRIVMHIYPNPQNPTPFSS